MRAILVTQKGDGEMTSIDFGKKCQPYNLRYRDIFGYVPCRDNYICTQEEYFSALLKAIETKQDISTFVPERTVEPKGNCHYRGFSLNGDYYEKTLNGIIVKISKENYTDATSEYAYKIAELYNSKKAEIFNYIAQKTTKFYSSRYSTEEIKARLNDPYIEIFSENWGVLVWLNHRLDEHIIECEFNDDMQLFHVSLSG